MRGVVVELSSEGQGEERSAAVKYRQHGGRHGRVGMLCAPHAQLTAAALAVCSNHSAPLCCFFCAVRGTML